MSRLAKTRVFRGSLTMRSSGPQLASGGWGPVQIGTDYSSERFWYRLGLVREASQFLKRELLSVVMPGGLTLWIVGKDSILVVATP